MKHPETSEGQIKRGRGRPRKYPPKAVSDFENTKYSVFFTMQNRKSEEGINIDNEIPKIINTVFDDIFKGQYKEKLFSRPQKVEEDPLFNNLLNKKENLNENENNNNINNINNNNQEKKEKNCNEVFYEYLNTFKNNVNEKYFTLMLKFVILFRECYDKSKNKEISGDGTKENPYERKDKDDFLSNKIFASLFLTLINLFFSNKLLNILRLFTFCMICLD